MNKGWTKNSISRLLVKFRTVDRRLGSGRRSAHTDGNVDTDESLLLSQEDKSQSHRAAREISREAGDPSIIGFADYSQSSSATRKGTLNSWLKRTACTRYFWYAVWETIISKPTWKSKRANSILEPSEYFYQISSKSIHTISSYTVAKLGRFLRHSVYHNFAVKIVNVSTM